MRKSFKRWQKVVAMIVLVAFLFQAGPVYALDRIAVDPNALVVATKSNDEGRTYLDSSLDDEDEGRTYFDSSLDDEDDGRTYLEPSSKGEDKIEQESTPLVGNSTPSGSILDASAGEYDLDLKSLTELQNGTANEENPILTGKSLNTSREIIAEIPELREPNVKYFVNADGTNTAAIYNHDVHYLADDGTYKDIDNSLLSTETSAGKSVITNEESSTDFYFAQDSTEGNMVSVRAAGYDLKWRLDTSTHKNTKKSKAKVKSNPSVDTVVKEDVDFDDVKDTVSVAEYPNIMKNIDIEYVLLGTKIKENIVINDVSAISDFSFILTSETLFAKKKGQEIIFSNADGEIVYTMSEPIMYDANNVESTDIKLKLKTISETEDLHQYQLTISPSKKWLQDENRVYPVIVDPTISTVQKATSIEDAHVNSDHPSTNYKTSNALVMGTNSTGNSRTYIRFDLPEVVQSIDNRVIAAELNLCPNVSNAYSLFLEDSITSAPTFYAFAPDESWDSGEITWNNQPGWDTFTTLDYHTVGIESDGSPSLEWATYDITSIVDKWCTGEAENNGVMIKGTESTQYVDRAYYYSSDWTNTSYKPVIQIAYANMIGLEDYWTYQTHSMGLAGTAYINNFTGSLTTVFQDYSFPAEFLTLGINHVYSSSYANKVPTSAAGVSLNPGKGFRLNIQEHVVKETINGTTLYRYTDADGTQHYFQNVNGVWEDDSGLGLTLKISPSGYSNSYVITDKMDNVRVFNITTGYMTSVTDNTGHSITLAYSGALLQSAVDEAGHKVTFDCDISTGVLNKMIFTSTSDDEWEKEISYTYSSGYLVSVTYPGGSSISTSGNSGTANQSQFSFGTNGAMVLMRDNVANKNIIFEYETTSSNKGLRVNHYGLKSSSYSTSILNSQTEFEIDYTPHSTRINEIKPVSGRYQFYVFNYNGQTTSAQDEEGNAVYSETGIKDGHQNEDSENNKNKLTFASKTQKSTVNLLTNHSFENGTTGYSSTGTGYGSTSLSTVNPFLGDSCLRVSKSTSNMNSTITGRYQNVTSLAGGKSYTLSAYVKTENCTTNGAILKLEALNGTTIMASSYTDKIVSDGEYMRFETTLDLTGLSGTYTLRSYLGLVDVASPAIAYFDCVQLEVGKCSSRYNLIENSDFEDGLTSWSVDSSINTLDGIVLCSDVDTKENTEMLSSRPNGGNCYKIGGQADKSKKISQEINVSGESGDSFVFGCWVKSNGLVNKDDGSGTKQCLGITVKFDNTDGTSSYENLLITPTSDEWQYICGQAVAPQNYNKIIIYLKFIYNRNYAYFDDVQFYKDTFGQSFIYDSNGNIQSVVDMANNTATVVTNGNNDVTSYTDGKGQVYSLEYDGGNTSLKNHNLTQAVKPDGLTYDYVYGSHGNMTSATVSNPGAGTSKKIVNNFEYIGNGAYLGSSTNQLGNSTTYTYDFNTGVETSRTMPGGEIGKSLLVEYLYDPDSLFLTKISGNSSDPVVQYSYMKNRLSSMKWGTDSKYQTYHYGYNSSGDLISIGRSSSKNLTVATLESYTPLIGRGLVSSVSYANGQSMHYEFDNQDRVTSLSDGNGKIAEYFYDAEGLLTKTLSYGESSLSPIIENNAYDLAGRLIVSDNSKGSGIKNVSYDANNLLSGYDSYLKNSSADLEYSMTHTYVEKDANGNVAYGVDKPHLDILNNGSMRTYYHYDAYGRNTVESYTPASSYVDSTRTTYSYLDLDSSRTTFLPETITVDYNSSPSTPSFDKKYTLTYDRAVNITDVVTNLVGSSFTTTYNYDYRSRLTGASNINGDGKIYSYGYDERNNLVSVIASKSGTNISTKTYNYNDADIDRLTSVSDVTASGTYITNYTYDEIGNPETIVTTNNGITTESLNLEWKCGKMLDNISSGSSLNNSYYYDAEGNITKKVLIDGSYVNYHYLAGKLEFEEHYNSNDVLQYVLKYFYDSDGNLQYLLHKADNFQDDSGYTLYAYIRNGVDDISELVCILDSTGTSASYPMELAASYEYDAYGNILNVENHNGYSIAEINPVRYKDYQYDSETGWYYLYNRFYDPEIGRFINADAITIPDDYKSNYYYQNLYAYCDGNPVMCEDDSGNIWQLAIGVCGAAISAATEAASQLAEYGEVKYVDNVIVSAVGGFASVFGPVGMAIDAACTAYTYTNKAVDDGDFSVTKLGINVALGIVPGVALNRFDKIKKLDEPTRAFVETHFSGGVKTGFTISTYYGKKIGTAATSNNSVHKRGSANRKGTNSRPFNAPVIRGIPANRLF